MKQLPVIIFLSILVLLFGYFLWQNKANTTQTTPPQIIETAQSVVTLEIFTPTIRITEPNASEREAKHGDTIPVGTTIKTENGARGQLIYPDHTVTRLDSNTTIVLKKFAVSPKKTSVRLEKGRIWSRVAKLLGQETYQSETNTVVATVRGTSYGHEKLPGGSDKITATKRDVVGTCVNQAQQDDVEQGTKTIFDCEQGSDPQESDLTNEDTNDEWFTFNNEKDKELNDRFGLESYQDEDNVLGLETTPDPVTNILPPSNPTIDCVGADGKISRVTQAVCDRVRSFWQTHPPAPNPPASNNLPNPPATGGGSSTNPTPTPTPIPDMTGPVITNLVSPNFLSGFTCSVTFSADLSDPSGISSASMTWQSYDVSIIPDASGSASLTGPTGGGTWSTTTVVTIPPDGYLDWFLTAVDNASSLNQISTSSGTLISTDTMGCGFAAL